MAGWWLSHESQTIPNYYGKIKLYNVPNHQPDGTECKYLSIPDNKGIDLPDLKIYNKPQRLHPQIFNGRDPATLICQKWEQLPKSHGKIV